ncbi:MAG: nicotinate-nicotinamide nucleotide adenylyltransferase, partial [bacterium]|nr:nicotinate-nicotinamide nucleotide adenylyltransferase [bacterium]
MRIGILGSTCDPPHKDHILAAHFAKLQFKLDRIIIVPSHIPTHKSAPMASPTMRLAMAKLAIGQRRYWSVSSLEIRRGGITYVRDTISALKKKYPRADLFWILGSDSLA